MKNQDKKIKNRKILIIVVIVVLIGVLGSLVGLMIVANSKNKQVDKTANEISEQLDLITIDFSQPVDKNKAYANIVELSIVLNSNINENSLMYFDGSKAKYNEIKDKANKIMDDYRIYFNSQNEQIFNGANIDINSATKDELNTAYNSLVALSSDIEATLNSTIWDEDQAWSMLWGDNHDEAKANYSDFKTKVDTKANEIKARLDEISTQEAANAQAAAQSSNSANSKNYSNNYSGNNGNKASSYEEWCENNRRNWETHGGGSHGYHVGPNGEIIQDW